jgi:catalase
LPVNAPIVPVVNFQRDGPAAYISQGSLPNYQSSLDPLDYGNKKGTIDSGSRDEERQARHEAFVGGAWRDLSFVTEREFFGVFISLSTVVNVERINFNIVDFEQPRVLWSKVWDDKAREAYVQNVSGHFKNVKSPQVKARQRKAVFVSFVIDAFSKNCFVVSVWAAVDQGLSDRIAAAIGHPSVKPLAVKPASEADKYRFVDEK